MHSCALPFASYQGVFLRRPPQPPACTYSVVAPRSTPSPRPPMACMKRIFGNDELCTNRRRAHDARRVYLPLDRPEFVAGKDSVNRSRRPCRAQHLGRHRTIATDLRPSPVKIFRHSYKQGRSPSTLDRTAKIYATPPTGSAFP